MSIYPMVFILQLRSTNEHVITRELRYPLGILGLHVTAQSNETQAQDFKAKISIAYSSSLISCTPSIPNPILHPCQYVHSQKFPV